MPQGAAPVDYNPGSAWVSEGGPGVPRPLLRRGRGEAWDHGKCDQPWVDGEQRLEHFARGGLAVDPPLARAGVDADGTLGHARGCWGCSRALLLGKGPLDHGTGDLRGWGCLVDESRGPTRNPARLAGDHPGDEPMVLPRCRVMVHEWLSHRDNDPVYAPG
jgi:hypothetical protein